MSNIINALKRLERAGDENSRATEKLYEAAKKVAAFIEENVPAAVELPRGYKAIYVSSNIGSAKFLVNETKERRVWIDGIGGYLHEDYNCKIPAQTRTGVLDFAKDIAEGLLDEIALFLEKRAQESSEMTDVLNNSIPVTKLT